MQHPSFRRFVLFFLVALAAGATTPLFANGDTVRLLVGFPAGGGTDAIARLLADKLKDELGTAVLVENKAGAGGQLAAQAVKVAAPDGTTFFLSHDHTVSILPLVMKNPGFNPERDFAPVAGFASFVNAWAVSSATPAKNWADYMAWVKSQGRDKVTVGVPAPASVPEFLVKVLGEKYQLDLVATPYRGGAALMDAMLGNQTAAGVASVPDFIANHQAGKVRIVAVLGSARQNALPDVPTLAELGVTGFEDVPYYGIFAPVGTPQVILDRFSEALARVIAQPAVRDRLMALGLTVEYMSAQQLAARERAYSQSWARIIQATGFVPQ